jgi:hypothetical protein
MYEDVIKKSFLGQSECEELSKQFIDLSYTKAAIKGFRINGKNRNQLIGITYNGKRTELYSLLAPYRERLSQLFHLRNSDSLSLAQVFHSPCELPIHIDPAIHDRIRLIVLIKKPPIGGDIVLSEKAFSSTTIFPLEIGEVYQLPAHKYFHGVTFFNEGTRVTLNFDYLSI